MYVTRVRNAHVMDEYLRVTIPAWYHGAARPSRHLKIAIKALLSKRLYRWGVGVD
jgi:hypothetical protein